MTLIASKAIGAGMILAALVAHGHHLRAEPTAIPPGPNVAALAGRIDAALAARWAEGKVEPAPLAPDEEFLRRVYLDVAGRIPLNSEARAFLNDARADKRQRLVEALLDGPGYINHFTNTFRAMLLPEVETNNGLTVFARGFEAWLSDQLVRDVPYDRMIREMLASTASPDLSRPDGFQNLVGTPGAFFVARQGKPENLAASTSRIILGLRLECAQCHDHPTEPWKKEQFWSQAAFFSDLRSPGQANRDEQEPAVKMPGTEKLIQARYLDGSRPAWKTKTSPRVTLAEWVTSPNNPYFSRTIANRLWAHFFGTGLVDPVDDFSEEHAPSHPELLEELSRQLAAHDFDLKFLIRALTSSQAYQRSSRQTHPGQQDARLFARMAVRGLTPEQLYDSLSAATGLSDKATLGRGPGDLNPIESPRGKFLAQFARHENPAEAETTILQALTLMNGRLIIDVTGLDNSATLAAVAGSPFLTPAQRIEELFLATLSRKPGAEEGKTLVDYVARGGTRRNPRSALADVFWALLNSPEFQLNH